MPGFQPRITTDHVWVNGTDIHTYDPGTGLGIRVTEIRGWDERPDVRDVRELRSGQDGEYADNLYLGGRTIAVSGVVHGSSWVDLQARKRALAALFQPSSAEVLLKIPDPATAWSSYAISFNGSSGYGSATYAAALNPASFTVEAWIYLGALGADQDILDCITGNTGFRLQVNSSNRLACRVGTGATTAIQAGSVTLAASTWYHVAATHSGGSLQLYVNGVADGSALATAYSANASAATTIARRSSGATNYFNGRIDEVAIYGSALSSSTLAAHYSLGATAATEKQEYQNRIVADAAVAYWRSDDSSTSMVDRVAARNATLAGTYTNRVAGIPGGVEDYSTYATTGMTGYERVSCRVVESIMFGDMVGSAAMTFQVILRASDPRVYSDTESSTDSGTSGTAARTVTVDQGGTYETPPTLTVTGPTGSEFSVSEPSSGLSLTMSGATLAASDTLVFDTNNRTVTGQLQYESAVLLSSPAPVALWMLDETSGTTADNAEGTSARDGTYTAGFTLNQDGPNTLTAVDLNGSTGYVAIPHVAALYPTTPILTGWMRLDTTASNQCIYDGITSNLGFRVEYSSLREFRVTIGTGSTTLVDSTAGVILSTSTWYRFAIRVDGTSLSVRVRNEAGDVLHSWSDASAWASPYAAATSGGARLGSTLAGATFFNGRLAAVGLYDSDNIDAIDDLPVDNGDDASLYQYLSASSSRWANLGTASSTYTLDSSGLNTGSKLNVAYRDARL